MPAASGSYKQIIIKKQTAEGTLPTASGARVVSRTDGVFNLSKEALNNDRIRSDLQPSEARHGVRNVTGNISDHLAPGAATDLLGTALKRVFTAVAPVTGLSVTIAAVANGAYTITRSTGSWFTGGLRIGMGCRLTAGTFNAANLNKTLFVVDLTATVATVLVVNGSALVAEGPIASATLTVPGKYSFMPTTGHVEEVYAVEEWQPDVPYSEVYLDWRPHSSEISIPANGNATIAFAGEGKDLVQHGAARYFTNPTAESNAPVLTGVNGLLRVAGASYCVTSLTINHATPYSGDPCIGRNTREHRFAESPTLSGSFSAYFTDGVLPALFYDETVTSIDLVMSADNSAGCEFLTFSLPRVKVNSADKPGGRGGILRTYNFTASLNPTSGAREVTSLAVHDSLAP
jgi:hypothetical protein